MGFTVKAVPETVVDGEVVPAGEVSNFLHDNLFEGDPIGCSLPFGDLVLEDREDPLLLVSAGIGCTPILGMLHYLVRTGSERPVTVLHADRSLARHPHRQELAELVGRLDHARLHHWYEDLGVRPSTETVQPGLMDLHNAPVDPDAQVYLCGPLPFMDAVRSTLAERGVPESHVHYEVFGPDTWVSHAEPEQVGA